MNQRARLSVDDVKRLMEDRSVAAQIDMVTKLSSDYTANGDATMTPSQSALADDVFRLLLNKAEVQVRALIAQNLKQCDKLPVEIARQMANDVQEVALPVIEYSQLLTDDELLKIIDSTKEHGKLVAIAKRNVVSEAVSDALIETRVEQVATTLIRNEGAAIAEKTLHKIVEYHNESVEVMGSMLERNAMPIAVIDKLVDSISATLCQKLETKYGNLVELKELRSMLDKSMDMARFKLMGLNTSDGQLSRLIGHLDKNGKLFPFTALSMANLELFEMSLARILHIPINNVRQLLKYPNGLKAVYKKAELPDDMYEAVALCVEAILALQEEYNDDGVVKFLPTPVQLIQRMRQINLRRNVANVDYLYNMISEEWANVW